MQDVGSGEGDEASFPKAASLAATVVEGASGSPQQLKSAVDELTGQLESAQRSLQACTHSPAAQRQLDASLGLYANPAQALLGRQRLAQAASQVAAADSDDMDIDSEVQPEQPVLAGKQAAEVPKMVPAPKPANAEAVTVPVQAGLQRARTGTPAPEARAAAEKLSEAVQAAAGKAAYADSPGRDSSPDFGAAPLMGAGGLASVLEIVGKLCRDIDPTQSNIHGNRGSQPAAAAGAVRTDLQAAAMLAEAAGRAKSGTMGGVARQAPKAAQPQRMQISAHAADLTHGTTVRAALSGQQLGSERSAGSAGSWEVFFGKTAEQECEPNRGSETTLTATRGPSKHMSAEQAAPGDEIVNGADRSGAQSAFPAAAARCDSARGAGVKEGGNMMGRVHSKGFCGQGKNSVGGNGSRLAQALTAEPFQAPAQKTAAQEASSKIDKNVVAEEARGDHEVVSSSTAGIKTTVNTPLSTKCILGCVFSPFFSDICVLLWLISR